MSRNNCVMLKLFYLFSIVVLFFIVGCATSETLSDRRRMNLEPLPAQTLIEKNRRYATKIRYLKAVATLNVESLQSAMQVKCHLAVRYPDSMYVKMEGFLGIDGLVASINRNDFTVYHILNQQVFKGPTSQESIRKVFDYQVAFDEMRDAITGLVFLNETDLPQILSSETDSGYYVLTMTENEGTKKIWLDPLFDYAITRIEHYNSKEEIILLKEFSRFTRVDGFLLPKYVRILRPKEKDLLSFYFELRSVNQSFSSRLFHIQYPKQAEVIDVTQIK